MTLAQWVDSVDATISHTATGSVVVLADRRIRSLDAYTDLWHLEDYTVSSTSGCHVHLIPVTPAEETTAMDESIRTDDTPYAYRDDSSEDRDERWVILDGAGDEVLGAGRTEQAAWDDARLSAAAISVNSENSGTRGLTPRSHTVR